MIIFDFLVFVISSGLFCSEKFRGHVWAVIVAGAIATGSSLLFVYDLGAKLTGHENQPPVITKIIKQPVVKTVLVSRPASAGKPHNCESEYPAESLARHEEGITKVGFKILTDGTVDAIKVIASSGSQRLDEAAVKCVANWHYRPAIRDGQLAETSTNAVVHWVLQRAEQAKQEAAAQPAEIPPPPADATTPAKDAPAESHPWYDVGSWFSSDKQDKQGDAKSP
jgi:TonB family protein